MTDFKELKRQYKETPRPMGVYRLRNSTNERSLVGSSRDVPSMLNRHRAQLSMGVHSNKELQKDWDALGSEAFEFEVLDTLALPKDNPAYDPTEDLRALEELWLERLKPFGESGYNPPPKKPLM